jgi:hypothetical protein
MLLITILIIVAGFNNSCGIYKFKDVSIPENIKTVRINFIENRAPYVNPQLSPNLTDKLKQKILNQTKLTQTNNDNANYDVHGFVSDYSVSTTGVTSTNGRSQSSINRLTVSVHIVLNDQVKNETQEFDVSRNFDFSANQSLQAVEAGLLDEIVRNLSDEIFNHIFSNW